MNKEMKKIDHNYLEEVDLKKRFLYKITSSRVMMEILVFVVITMLLVTNNLEQDIFRDIVHWMLVAFFGSKAVEHGTKGKKDKDFTP